MLVDSSRLYSAILRSVAAQFGVAVADVAAVVELVVDVAAGAVVAAEFHFSAGR